MAFITIVLQYATEVPFRCLCSSRHEVRSLELVCKRCVTLNGNAPLPIRMLHGLARITISHSQPQVVQCLRTKLPLALDEDKVYPCPEMHPRFLKSRPFLLPACRLHYNVLCSLIFPSEVRLLRTSPCLIVYQAPGTSSQTKEAINEGRQLCSTRYTLCSVAFPSHCCIALDS